MPEVNRVMRPIELDYLCDKCEAGMVHSTGLETEKGFEHKCVICGEIDFFKNRQYPEVVFVPTGESVDPS